MVPYDVIKKKKPHQPLSFLILPKFIVIYPCIWQGILIKDSEDYRSWFTICHSPRGSKVYDFSNLAGGTMHHAKFDQMYFSGTAF